MEKIGGNKIILPNDQRQPFGSYFRLRRQALLGHGTNDIVLPVVPGSKYLSYVSGYVDDTSDPGRPTMWVFGTNDCVGDHDPTAGSCGFNSSDPSQFIPCACPPGAGAAPRSEVWALWSSDPQLRPETWRKRRVLTMPPELPIFNTDVTRGPSGHVSTRTTRQRSQPTAVVLELQVAVARVGDDV